MFVHRSVNLGRVPSVFKVAFDFHCQRFVFPFVQIITLKQRSDCTTMFDEKHLLVGFINDEHPILSSRISTQTQENHHKCVTAEVHKIEPKRKLPVEVAQKLSYF